MNKQTKNAITALIMWFAYLELLVILFVPFGIITLFLQPLVLGLTGTLLAITVGSQTRE